MPVAVVKKTPGDHPLQRYRDKRDFQATPEPSGEHAACKPALRFVVQKHAARQLHYDFRLELDGTLKSWAVPKGPSLDPKTRRMAVEVEDHPLDYASFEGTIPVGHYGAGEVIVWDEGQWQPHGDARAGHAAGKLKFGLSGHKLQGDWTLVRMRARDGERQHAWLLIKERDAAARSEAEFSVVQALPASVKQPSALAAARAPTGAKPGAAVGASAGKKTATRAIAKAAGAATTAAATPPVTRARAAARSQRAQPPLPADIASVQHALAPLRPAAKPAALPDAAEPAALPAALAPALATLVDAQPAGSGWRYELKFDGYRLLARVERGAARLFTRNGHDWTAKLPALAHAVAGLGFDAAWLDGELVVMGEHGAPDFQALQNAFENRSLDAVRYYLFDLPFHAGHDLRAAPLVERRALLRATLAAATPQPVVRFSEDFAAEAADVLQAACRLHLEGVIGKRLDSAYPRGRSNAWIKLKCSQRQEFVIGGYTDPKGSRVGLGALLLGYYDDSDANGSNDHGAHEKSAHAPRLRYAGNVGTGFPTRMLEPLTRRLAALGRDAPPFDEPTGQRGAHWVEPELVAEVSFAEWTAEGRVRHAVFKGLREDKPPREIGREPHGVPARASAGKAASPGVAGPALRSAPAAATATTLGATLGVAATPSAKAARAAAGKAPRVTPAGKAPRVTHPERVVDAISGHTKGELVAYYERVAKLMLPHLGQRPVALLRAPAGVGGASFFQKHADARELPGVRRLAPALDPGHEPLIAITSAAALVGVAQMNTIEIHTWNATARAIEKPDRLVFDLDPGEGVAWQQVVEAAHIVRDLLDALGLVSFLKTSGGKGLHLVLPLTPRHGWVAVKGFSQALVQHLAAHARERFVAVSGPRNRVGRIYVDYLRNGRGATTVAAYSVRARPGLPISLPLAWGELDRWDAQRPATIATPQARLEASADTWAGYATTRQTLSGAMKMLGFKPKAE